PKSRPCRSRGVRSSRRYLDEAALLDPAPDRKPGVSPVLDLREDVRRRERADHQARPLRRDLEVLRDLLREREEEDRLALREFLPVRPEEVHLAGDAEVLREGERRPEHDVVGDVMVLEVEILLELPGLRVERLADDRPAESEPVFGLDLREGP